jgi:hypothetical protein
MNLKDRSPCLFLRCLEYGELIDRRLTEYIFACFFARLSMGQLIASRLTEFGATDRLQIRTFFRVSCSNLRFLEYGEPPPLSMGLVPEEGSLEVLSDRLVLIHLTLFRHCCSYCCCCCYFIVLKKTRLDLLFLGQVKKEE